MTTTEANQNRVEAIQRLVEQGTHVTMKVPLEMALLVVDNEAGDAHTEAVCAIELKMCEILLEEYGVNEEIAWDINAELRTQENS